MILACRNARINVDEFKNKILESDFKVGDKVRVPKDLSGEDRDLIGTVISAGNAEVKVQLPTGQGPSYQIIVMDTEISKESVLKEDHFQVDDRVMTKDGDTGKVTSILNYGTDDEVYMIKLDNGSIRDYRPSELVL